MPPKKSTSTRKKKDGAITSVELVDDAAVTTPPRVRAVNVIPSAEVVEEQVLPPPAVVEEQVLPPPAVVEEQVMPPPAVVEEVILPVVVVVPPPVLQKFAAVKIAGCVDDDVVVVVVGNFKDTATLEPDDIRDAAGDADAAFNFPPPDVIDNKENVNPIKRPEWLKYEQDNPLFDTMRARRTDIQENQFKRIVPTHTLRGMEDSDVEADIGDMI